MNKINLITDEEYQSIEKRIQEILDIQNDLTLTNNGHYKAHFPLAENFEELIINLIRNNREIDRNIKLIIKNFTKSGTTNIKTKQKLSKIIKRQQEKLEQDTQSKTETTPTYFTSIASVFPEFNLVKNDILEQISKKKFNFALIKEIEMLQNEYNQLITLKTEYEKKQSKKLKKSERNEYFANKKRKSTIIK